MRWPNDCISGILCSPKQRFQKGKEKEEGGIRRVMVKTTKYSRTARCSPPLLCRPAGGKREQIWWWEEDPCHLRRECPVMGMCLRTVALSHRDYYLMYIYPDELPTISDISRLSKSTERNAFLFSPIWIHNDMHTPRNASRCWWEPRRKAIIMCAEKRKKRNGIHK